MPRLEHTSRMREIEDDEDDDDDEEEEMQKYKISALPMKRRRGRPRLEKNTRKDNLERWNEGICIYLKIILYKCGQFCWRSVTG